MAAEYVLGIDIGTTFTAAAVGRDGRATVCTLGTRAQSIPTVVAVLPDGQVLVGEPAERRASIDPTQVAREFKRRLGDTTPLVLGGTAYTPQALMAHVLKHVIREVTVAEDGPPTEVVLTHPAHFGPYKRELMGEVIRLADVGNARLITEPEAAAISYAQKAVIEPGRTVAVYDLGGGTFDAALVRRSAGGGFELVGSADGIDRLGGVDFDQLLLDIVLEKSDVSSEVLAEARPAEIAGLRQRCRDAKEALSADQVAEIAVGLGGIDSVEVTRNDLEAAVRPRVLESVESLQRVIRSSGLSSTDIDRVLLVGGSSRIPLVAATVRTTLALPVAVDANPKFAICTGAALPADSGVPAGGEARATEAEPTVLLTAAAGAPPDPVGPPTERLAATPPPPPAAQPGGSSTSPAAPAEQDGGPPTVPMPATPTSPIPVAPTTAASPPANNNRRNGMIAAGALAIAAIVGGVVALSGGDDKPSAGSTSRSSVPVVVSPTNPSIAPTVPGPTVPTATVPTATLPAATVPAITVAPATVAVTESSTATQATTGGATTATTPASTTVPATTPAVTETVPPTTPPAVDRELTGTVYVGGAKWDLQHLTVDPVAKTLTVDARLQNISRNRLEALADSYGVRYEGSDLGLGVSVAGSLDGTGATSAATLTTRSLPDGFDINRALLVMGNAGDHQAVVDLGSGTILEDLAPIPLAVSGTATTGFGVAFTAKDAQIVPWACTNGSERIGFEHIRSDEWSLIVHGDLVTGDVPRGGTTITDIVRGFTRLKFPDGTTVEASATVDNVFNSNERYRDALICFGGLTAPGDGSYQLQIQSGEQEPTGTLDILVPPGTIVPDNTATSDPGPAAGNGTLATTVYMGGGMWTLDGLSVDPSTQTLTITGTLTDLSRSRFGAAGEPIAVRYDGSDLQPNVRYAGDINTSTASSRFTATLADLPADFDLAKAQLVFGQSGNHQAVVDLGTGKATEDLAPVPVEVAGTGTTGYGIVFTATNAEIVPWECSGGSAHLAFANNRNDEWSLIVHGTLVTGDTPIGGTTITDVANGFTRLQLPDGTNLNASATVDNVFGKNQRFRDAVMCFSGLLAPGDGNYQVQFQAGDQPPTGTIDVTIPPGAIEPDTPPT